MNDGINISDQRNSGARTILGLFEDAARYDGIRKLQELVRGLGELFNAETTFVAHALDDPVTRVRGVAAWKDGAPKESWDYELEGNPCQLTYGGEPTFIPCDVASEFEKKKDSGYSSYIGIPLKNPAGDTIGHIAIYASQEHATDSYALEVAQIAGHLAQAEIQRIIAENKLQENIDSLSSQQVSRKETLQTVAHDIRSPLSSVINALELAEEDDNPETVAIMVAGAKKAAQRLLAFTSTYLDLERLEHADTANLRDTRVVVKTLLDDVLSMARDVAMNQGVTISVTTFDEQLSVMGSAQELARALSNLISNAIKYSPFGGTVEISVSEDAGHVTVSVRDQGPGVPDAMSEIVFEAFESGTSPANHPVGSGLGLAIAKKVVDRHGGEIGFQNHNPGCTFFFKTPM